MLEYAHKMKTQLKNTHSWAKKKILAAFIILVLLIMFGAAFTVQKIHYYNDAADQANSVRIRELILLAVRGIKKDAPVDPKTGDIYFPESRLYLPNPGLPLTITYLFDRGNITDSLSGLSVSTYPVRGTQALYTANNMNEVFDAVPKLQACSRGIKLIYEKFPTSDAQNVLKHTVQLSNGRTLYIYLERDCPELNDTANLFKNIKTY